MIVNNNTIAKATVKKLSFSFSSNMKNTSIKHNERKPSDEKDLKDYGKHINWSKTADNEIIISKPIKQVYKDVFQSSVDAYNEKQKRSDRKIKNYFGKVKKSKNLDVQKEFIIQAGKMGQQLSSDPVENEKLQKQVLETYLDTFQKTYPQLHVYSAVIHVDEKSPHMHMAVVPEASGYKRGVSKQPSFSKAVGIKNIDDFRQFCEANRNLLKQSVEQVLGADVEREEVGTHAYLPPQALRDAWAKADEKTQQAEETLDDAKDEASEIVAKAKEEAKKIASDAKTKADVNREVMQYRADKMSQVDSAVKAYAHDQKSKVDNAVVAYKEEEKTKIHNALKTYYDEEKKKADDKAEKIKTDAKTDASLILSDAKSKRTDAVARENAVAGREADISAREAVLQANETKYADNLQMLQKQQEEQEKKEQDLEKRQQELEKKKKELQAWEDALGEKEKKFNEKVLDFWKRIKKWSIKRVKHLGHLSDEEMHKEKPLSDIDEIEIKLDGMEKNDQSKGMQM